MTDHDVISTNAQTTENLHFINCAPIVGSIGQLGSMSNLRHYSVRKSYINHTTMAVTIQERIGLSISLPASPQPDVNNVFIVRLELDFHASIRRQVELTLSYLDDSVSAELKLLKDCFNKRAKENLNGGIVVFLDYPVNLEQIRACGGSVYLKEMDVVLSIMPPNQTPDHPANVKNYDKALKENMSNSESCFMLNVDVIDNDGTLGVHYMRVGEQVYRLATRKNKALANGVYHSSNANVSNAIDTGRPEVRLLQKENFENYGIFTSFEDAKTWDGDTNRKTELIKLEHELQLSKTNASLIKAQHEKDLMEKELKLKAMMIENEQLIESQRVVKSRIEKVEELKMMGIKNNYEELSYTRKNESEVVKFLPTLILGIGAAVLAFTKFFK